MTFIHPGPLVSNPIGKLFANIYKSSTSLGQQLKSSGYQQYLLPQSLPYQKARGSMPIAPMQAEPATPRGTRRYGCRMLTSLFAVL
jgi:hypothetical protein